MRDSSHRRFSSHAVGDLLLACYLVVATAAQLLLYVHAAPPWRDWLLLVSVIVEFAGLYRLSDWINRVLDVRLDVEERPWLEAPVVLASSGTPAEDSISEAQELASTMHRPVLLLNLAAPGDGDTAGWIAAVRSRMTAAGLCVSTQEVFTREPESAIREIALALEPSSIIWAAR